MYLLVSIIIAALLKNAECNAKDEQQCVDYYKTGDNFDLNLLEGAWYAVYYWPPVQRQRKRCELVNFKKTTKANLEGKVSVDIPEQNLIESSYRSSAGKPTHLVYYGQDEVKNQVRSSNRVSKYIFIDVDDGYVLGINCSNGGRGVLLARNLPTSSEVEDIVEDIEIMAGRRGSPDCHLEA
ncbi:uncharacterized protein LOC119831716 [Zerene cesonia]|uniref:uncharacterized protein LOC119831716 n=1 Tax=Zerene cesonia TaxID=33412 RepID=UPI0018E50FD5|nr:uncharacterized protein LOC119831716 [Zerene cesonia]